MTPDERRFLTDFEQCRLAAGQWTHRTHVHMAWLQLQRAPWPGAIEKIRAGIQRFNSEALNRSQHYHDTVTVAFARLIAAARLSDECFEDFCRRNPDLLSRESLLAQFYSDSLLNSDAARQRFIEPDLKPLPAVR